HYRLRECLLPQDLLMEGGTLLSSRERFDQQVPQLFGRAGLSTHGMVAPSASDCRSVVASQENNWHATSIEPIGKLKACLSIVNVYVQHGGVREPLFHKFPC